ncbi:multisubunit potassium/proton antiporter, PhaE subunit [Arboricoccus pini]|uniref:Multisubunit potassium/proton antiporter, PhaE subunit n=1 Tax=Arboricoccus pini TaxID=1963835 RepID=A0A212Q2Z1_9PROT|nr:Na+/H+ antiporter subunit E [Arboricoccus pini]SNB53623.1 multisubunit potassium/proton antiporter, PhaE subunit [Arboricoccus pini]
MWRRLFPHPYLSFLIPFVWLLLVNTITPIEIILGAALGLLLPWYTQRFWPERLQIRKPLKLLGYVGIVLRDIVAANIDVARLVLFRSARRLRPGFVTLPLDIHTPEAILILVATISLTPGTIGADVSADGRAILVHGLDVPDGAAMVRLFKERYERRLIEIFE